jgi:TRAP-type C4-dicarboxylate transport system permease small subunit
MAQQCWPHSAPQADKSGAGGDAVSALFTSAEQQTPSTPASSQEMTNRTSPFDPIYKLTGFLAAGAMASIAGLILAEVVVRQLGGQIPSGDDFSSYALAATALLALGPTYRANEHIRVGLLVDRLTGNARRVVEVLCLVVAAVATGWACYWSAHFVIDSYKTNEMSQGLLAIKLWPWQLSMPVGFGVLLLALLDDLLHTLGGGTPVSMSAPADDAEALPTFER